MAVEERKSLHAENRGRLAGPGRHRPPRISSFEPLKVLRTFGGILGVAAACGFLLDRLRPDVAAKPLYEDEAISGLISMRPLREVLETVVLDRGGAPLHFALAHLAFAIDASPEALRWLSVLCALGAVPLTFDLGVSFVLDLAPPSGGRSGRVCFMVMQGGLRSVEVADSFSSWLERFANDLDGGAYVVDAEGGYLVLTDS